jgi:hypothetical protein
MAQGVLHRVQQGQQGPGLVAVRGHDLGHTGQVLRGTWNQLHGGQVARGGHSVEDTQLKNLPALSSVR